MLWIRPWRVQLLPCRSRAEKRLRVATIRLLLKFQATPRRWPKGPRECLLNLLRGPARMPPQPARQTVLLVQRKDHVDRGVYFHRLAVEQSRLVAPLTNSVKRRLLQERVAGDHFQLLNRAIFADDGVQADRARNASLPRERWIDGLNAIHDLGGLNLATNANRTRWFRLRRRRRSANAANHATQNATHRTAGNAAGNTTHGANDARIRLGFFLDDFDFLRDDFRRHKFAGIHQVNLRTHFDNLHCGRRGRRRWRRRRGGEHRGHHRFRQCLGVNQRDKNQDAQKSNLDHGRDHDGHGLLGSFRIRTRNDHLVKHNLLTSYRRERDAL